MDLVTFDVSLSFGILSDKKNCGWYTSEVQCKRSNKNLSREHVQNRPRFMKRETLKWSFQSLFAESWKHLKRFEEKTRITTTMTFWPYHWHQGNISAFLSPISNLFRQQHSSNVVNTNKLKYRVTSTDISD